MYAQLANFVLFREKWTHMGAMPADHSSQTYKKQMKVKENEAAWFDMRCDDMNHLRTRANHEQTRQVREH
jgi:hypothetical protein